MISRRAVHVYRLEGVCNHEIRTLCVLALFDLFALTGPRASRGVHRARFEKARSGDPQRALVTGGKTKLLAQALLLEAVDK